MRQADVKHPGVKLRSIFTGGESLGGKLLGWVRATFGIDAHEVFGQTECNLVIGSNSKTVSDPARLDGKATPGFDVRIVNDKAEECPGSRGIIAVRQPNPCTMLELLAQPGSHGQEICRGFPADRRSRHPGSVTLISGTSAARMT